MSLELLVNELLLDLFEFLNGIHLLRAFYGLNSRFNSLLNVHFRTYGLDFRSVSKRDFDIICREYLPFIASRIIAFRLSNDDDTPQQIDLFLRDDFALRRFIHLRSLSLDSIGSIRTMHKAISQCHYLPYLTQLKLLTCFLRYNRKSRLDLINRIWSRPKLTHCHIDFGKSDRFVIPTVMSKSIEHVTIENAHLHFVKIARLFRCTPSIRNLNIHLKDSHDNKQLRSAIPSLYSLKLHVSRSSNVLNNLLQNMPNLCHLTIQTRDININGHQWKQIIVEYLPKLKVFRCEMLYRLRDFDIQEEEIDRILDSYRTPFWLTDHQWFIRCRWLPGDNKYYIRFYTLPYAFGFYDTHNDRYAICTKSTCPFKSDHCSYKRRTKLSFEHSLNEVLQDDYQLHNAQDLRLMLPYDNSILSNILRFKLTSMTVQDLSSDSGAALSQLQTLVDRTPCLYSLTIGTWWPSPVQQLVVDLICRSIRRLNLHTNSVSDFARCFNNQQCAAFIRSPLGIQCEVLKITVQNHASILELANTMPNLRALKVWCLDEWPYHTPMFPPIHGELTEWLRSRLSCIVIRETYLNQYIRLWIR